MKENQLLKLSRIESCKTLFEAAKKQNDNDLRKIAETQQKQHLLSQDAFLIETLKNYETILKNYKTILMQQILQASAHVEV